MSDYFDLLETREAAAREAQLMAALPKQVAHAQKSTAAFAQSLKDVDAASVTSRAALAKLPVIRKHELLERQQAIRASDPFGGFSALVRGPRMRRAYASPGPIYEPEGIAPDYWRCARGLYAAGFRAGDLVHNAFSYHMTPGAFIMESGAFAIGCTMRSASPPAAVASTAPVRRSRRWERQGMRNVSATITTITNTRSLAANLSGPCRKLGPVPSMAL